MIQTARAPIVQKYGGSSLSTNDKLRAVASKVLHSAEGGRPVVVVVSAMGNTTSELLDRARGVSPAPPSRELDVLLSSGERMSTALLAMAIEDAGGSAISLSGPQSGIRTDEQHTNATIVGVHPERVQRELARGRIVVVAGFQGAGPAGDITTLGRGGSDTTAVALAAAFGAERCEIYSDVPGVYTADPRLVDEPAHLRQIDSRLMAEYALHGARVLHPDCIALAQRDGVAIHARSTFGSERFTRIAGEADLMFYERSEELPAIAGVTSRKRRLHLHGQPGCVDLYERTLECLTSEQGLLRQRSGVSEHLLVDIEDAVDPDGITAHLRERLGSTAELREQLASVSIVTQPSITPQLARRVAEALEEADVAPAPAYHRPQSITRTVGAHQRERAVRALHAHFVEVNLPVGA